MAILSFSHSFLSLRSGVAGLACLSLAACVAPSSPPPQTASKPQRTAGLPNGQNRPPVTRPQSRPQPRPQTRPQQSLPPRTTYPTPQRPAGIPASNIQGQPPAQLAADIRELWRTFPGKTGVAVRRIDGDWSVSERGNELFPQQSVSKIWVAMTILDKVDKGVITLDDEITIGMDDLTLFYQPIRARVLREGQIRETVRDLLTLSITQSDCTANDSLLRYAGGPQAVRAFLREKGINNVRFGDGERLMQSEIAGIRWQQSYSLGRNFEQARAQVPDATRKRLLDNYAANPIDGAAPEAIAQALARLARGELLSPASTQRMLSTMERTRSGPNRLKAGVPSGWQFLHKTGTGQQFKSVQTGYNDVGIMTAPDGTRYAVVVMLGSTSAPIPDRMVMMQGVSRSVANSHYR